MAVCAGRVRHDVSIRPGPRANTADIGRMDLDVETWMCLPESSKTRQEPLRGESRYAPDAELSGAAGAREIGCGARNIGKRARDA